MASRQVVVELQLASGNALVNLGKLEIETKEYQQELRKLNAEIIKNGAATKQQQLRVAELAISIRRNQTVVRELKNDLSGATAAGLRFRDKMAEASRAGLGAFGLQAIGIASVTTAVIAGVRELSRLAAEIELVDARNKAIAGDSLPAFTQAAEANAEAIGLTRRQYVSLAADQALRLKQLGIEGDIVTELSTKTVEYAEQLSDFSGGQLDTAQASKLLNDALTGQTRGLKELGINVKASKGEIDAIAASLMKSKGLTKEQATAVATLQLAFAATEETMQAFGDQTLRIDEAQDRATAKMNEAKESLAEGLTPAFTNATEAGAELLELFSKFARINFGGIEGLKSVLTDFAREANEIFGGAINTFVNNANDAQIRTAQAVLKQRIELLKKESQGLLVDNQTRVLLEAEILRLSDAYDQLGRGIDIVAEKTNGSGTANEAQAKTVAELRKELTDLKEARDELRVDQVSELATNAQQIKDLEAQITALDGAAKKTKELTKEEKERIATLKEMAEVSKQAVQDLEAIQSATTKPVQRSADDAQNFASPLSSPQDRLLENTETSTARLIELYQAEGDAFQQVQDAKLGAVQGFAIAAGQLAEEGSTVAKLLLVVEKAAAIADVIIQTQREIAGYYAAYALIPGGPAIASTLAGAATTRAGISIGLIAAQGLAQFKDGGFTKKDGSNSTAVGVVHANEYVVPAPVLGSPRGKALVDELEAMRMRHSVRYAMPFQSGGPTSRYQYIKGTGGIRTGGTGVTAGMIASADLSRAIANMPPPVVNVHDINRVQGAVKATRVKSSL